jgi:hypothetical protein
MKRFKEKGEIDRELAWSTRPVTAEELWRASWNCPLAHADLGFERRYERLAAAINDIKGMFHR